MRIRFLIMSVFCGMLVLTAGCGEETKTTGQSGTGTSGTATAVKTAAEIPDPCTLIRTVEAEKILGEPARATSAPDPAVESIAGDLPNKSICSYETTGAIPRVLSIAIIKPCSMADFMNFTTPGAEMVEGIGMHAYWDQKVLSVHTTANVCVIASGAPGGAIDDAAALENAKAVANMIIEEMGIQEPE